MSKIKKNITILNIGDRADYDSYKKLHKEWRFVKNAGFKYVTTNYKRLLDKGLAQINTDKVIVFTFFPFWYWNKFIEFKGYKGIYGNRNFYKKFTKFWERVDKILKSSLEEKEVFFVNHPLLCGLYRDKKEVARRLYHSGIPTPKSHNAKSFKDLEKIINKGKNIFLKPRYGSMGKGITFLSWANWQTNFLYKDDKIISRVADKGWKFRDVTGNKKFINKILKKDITVEEDVNSLLIKEMKVDMRIYLFFNKVIYIYSRRNNAENITTNITQGAVGDPTILKQLPRHLVEKARKIAALASKALNLNLAGMDVMMNHNFRDVFILDVNVFPGFPKRRTFNLAQYMIKELRRKTNKGEIRFEKGCNL